MEEISDWECGEDYSTSPRIYRQVEYVQHNKPSI